MDVSIISWVELENSHARIAHLDAIFFEASATQSFTGAQARSAFRQAWLGDYLAYDSEHIFIALAADGAVVGYVVGALDDPAGQPRYSELTYFQALADHTRRFPAHLHINVATRYRSFGIGARLIEAFAAHARAKRVGGVHVITGKGMRNVGFYLSCGFAEIAEAPWKGRTVVMLGRDLR